MTFLNQLKAGHCRAPTMFWKLGLQINGTVFLPSLGQWFSDMGTGGHGRKWLTLNMSGFQFLEAQWATRTVVP